MSWKTTALESIFQNLNACLEDLNASDRALAETMLSPNGILSGYLGTELQNIENPDCVRIAQAAMQDLLDHSRKTPTAKRRECKMLNRWLEALALHLGIEAVPELVNPLEEDPDIVLLKDLHEPHTKADLADHLQVTEKTIQNKISAIEKGSGGVRLGGQLVHLHIKTTQASTQEKRLYQTVNRMHPLILQLNTAQVGSLLTALAKEENYYAINLFTAACIWELMSRDELAVMDGGKCILQLRGVRPFLSDKYDLTQHPNYKLTGDYDKKNMFDIEKFLDRHLKLKPSDIYDVVEADES